MMLLYNVTVGVDKEIELELACLDEAILFT